MAGEYEREPGFHAELPAPTPVRAPLEQPGVTRTAALLRQAVAPRAGIPNRVLARDLHDAGQTTFLPGPGAPSLIPPAPQRGVNPADGIAAITTRLLGTRPASQTALRRAATAWAAAVVTAIRAGAAASGAPHADQIADNEATEIPQAVEQILTDYFGPSARPGGNDLRDCHRDILALAARKQQEIRLQFRYDVIVETDTRGWFGYSGDDDLAMLDKALTDMPDQHVWGARMPLRFRRQMVAPGNFGTGGETDPQTNTITLYSTGMTDTPFDRSRALNLPGFEQTIRHEIGHTVEGPMSADAKRELFTDIMGWHEYPWAWISVRNSPYPTWRAERESLRAETGIADDQLDQWLAGFTMRADPGALKRSDTRVQGQRSYVRSKTQGDFLHSIKTSETPQGPEFDYALTAHNDYLAELYMFATSRPFWLASKISSAQKGWWRRTVFGTPATDSEILRSVGMEPDAQMRFYRLVPGLFTWPQISQAVAAAAVADNVA